MIFTSVSYNSLVSGGSMATTYNCAQKTRCLGETKVVEHGIGHQGEHATEEVST